MSSARVKSTSRQFSYIQVTPRQLRHPVYSQLESSPPVYSSNSQVTLARVISTLTNVELQKEVMSTQRQPSCKKKVWPSM